VEFEWDPQKAEADLKQHGVSDPDHSFDESRCLIVGLSSAGRLLIVSHADMGDRIRIISARDLTPKERSEYEEGDFA
jgi:uncharacterized protein